MTTRAANTTTRKIFAVFTMSAFTAWWIWQAPYGFEGNLWHTYLTYLLVNNENAFSTASEIRGEISGSINELAYHDFEIFKELYDFDFGAVEKALETSCYAMIADYKGSDDQGKMFNKRIRDRICELSRRLGSTESIDEFKRI